MHGTRRWVRPTSRWRRHGGSRGSRRVGNLGARRGPVHVSSHHRGAPPGIQVGVVPRPSASWVFLITTSGSKEALLRGIATTKRCAVGRILLLPRRFLIATGWWSTRIIDLKAITASLRRPLLPLRIVVVRTDPTRLIVPITSRIPIPVVTFPRRRRLVFVQFWRLHVDDPLRRRLVSHGRWVAPRLNRRPRIVREHHSRGGVACTMRCWRRRYLLVGIVREHLTRGFPSRRWRWSLIGRHRRDLILLRWITIFRRRPALIPSSIHDPRRRRLGDRGIRRIAHGRPGIFGEHHTR